MRNPFVRFPRITVAALLALLLIPSAAIAQVPGDQLWSDVDDTFLQTTTERDIVPERYRTVALDMAALQQILASAPLENGTDPTKPPGTDQVILSLPLPDSGFGRFGVVEAPIMEPSLAARFPQIKTYRGQGIDDPTAAGRFDLTPAGFHAMILSPAGSIYIDPYSRDESEHYISYRARDATRSEQTFSCGVREQAPSGLVESYRASKGDSGATLRTYRTAVAATGEYTVFHGGTVPLGQASIVTAMNRVNESL